MPNILHIGLPPKGMMFRDKWLERETSYCKLEIVPCVIENTDILDTVETFTQGLTPFKIDYGSFIARAALLGCDIPKDYQVDDLILYALQEGAVTETFTNNISASTLTGTMAENFMNTGLAKFGKIASQEFGVNFGSSAAEILNSLKDTIGLKGNLNAKEWGDVWNNAGTTSGRHFIREQLQNALKDSNGNLSRNSQAMSNAGANLVSNLVAMAKGLRPIYPQLWENSSSGTNYTFRVRLYNPNPASQKLHQKCIVNPLACLKALALPASTVTKSEEKQDPNDTENNQVELTTESNNCTYGPPLYVKVKSKGLFNMPIGMIENMSVVYGGDENSIGFNGRPSYVDVSLTFKPLYNNKVIMVDSTESSPANEFINMETLMDDPNRGQTDNNGQDTDVANNGGEVTTPQNQGDAAQTRISENDKQMNKALTGDTEARQSLDSTNTNQTPSSDETTGDPGWLTPGM